MTALVGVVLFRLRATWRARWGATAVLVLLIGLLGGLAMGAVCGARRTQSSFPAFVARTNPSDLHVLDLSLVSGTSDSDELLTALASIPNVTRVASWGSPNSLVLNEDGVPAAGADDPDGSGIFIVVSPNGLFDTQDRATVIKGRMADPNVDGEVIMSETAAQILGATLGQQFHLGFYSDAQTEMAGYGTASVPPLMRIDITVVGIVRFNDEVVEDDIDRLPTYVVLSPSVADRLIACCAARGAFAGVQLAHGASDVASVEAQISRALPSARITSVTSIQIAKAERAIEPQSLALGIFGGIAALAALLVAGQVISRQLRQSERDRSVLRDVGASPAMTAVDALVGIVVGVIAGALVAGGVAVWLSRLAPIGPVRAVDSSGVEFDWTVLVLGVLGLIVGLLAVAAILVRRGAPHRVAQRLTNNTKRTSVLARVATAVGMPIAVVEGVRFAVEPDSETHAAPVRSAILGGVLAIVVVVTTLIFGASLSALVSRPSLYGWNWDYELRSAYSGISNIPEAQATPLLNGDSDIAAWTGVYFTAMPLDGVTVPLLGINPDATIAPSILTGRQVRAADEAVLGANTLAELHKKVGDTITLDNGTDAPVTLTVVGTAALPALGIAETLHMELDTGAIVSQTLFAASDRGLGGQDGPEAYLVRFRTGIDRAAALRTLQTAADGMDSVDDGPVSILPVQRPAEIVNYRTMSSTPALLGSALALGATSAWALALIASVRRRQRDLAVFRVLGFTNRDLATVISCQSTFAVGIAAIIATPLGIIIGRQLWIRFAEAIHVVPQPSIPIASIVAVVVGSLILANLVATIPARGAAHTAVTVLLRPE